MKKKLAMLLVLAMALGMLSACSGSSSSSSSTDSSASTDSAASSSSAAADTTTEAVDDTVYKLTLHQHDPAASATGLFLEAWAADIEEASGGRIDIELYHGGTLGSAFDTVDMVLNGTVDIGWGLPSFFDGVFPASMALMLPMQGMSTSDVASQVAWHLYTDYDYLKEEYSDYHVLLLHTNCQAPLLGVGTKFDSVDDLAGQAVRVTSGGPVDMLNYLSASPISVAIGELYNAMDNGTVDGVLSAGWDAIQSYKFYEQTDYILDESFGVSPYFLLMNQDSYDSLPADLQAIMDDYSGEYALELAKDLWNDMEADARNTIATEYPEIEVYSLDDEARAEFQAVCDQVAADWIASTENGQEIYDAMQELNAIYSK